MQPAKPRMLAAAGTAKNIGEDSHNDMVNLRVSVFVFQRIGMGNREASEMKLDKKQKEKIKKNFQRIYENADQEIAQICTEVANDFIKDLRKKLCPLFEAGKFEKDPSEFIDVVLTICSMIVGHEIIALGAPKDEKKRAALIANFMMRLERAIATKILLEENPELYPYP